MAERMTRSEFGVVAAGIAVTGPSTGAIDMSTNLERFKAIVERGFSQGDLTVADEVCAETLIEHEYLSKTDIPGPQILKAQIEDARRSITDLTLTIEAIVETRDTVWARSKATGIDPRSGRPVAIDVMDICRFVDGKLVEHWGVPDRFALLHQIGALPPPPQGRP
ncbi:ester cyclase [Bradyrhizobium erythrophlei]|uniref:Ketosteroid isomerase-related protein n=1 Tax=Bradyrhizobium erythrophlei TaxID=1437360 RepID=A0A1H4MV75_9BRAD|nr:ester cyclase [Bradyrhizobium erythrophlei]SEB86405.1 Ketosteroid isomerase-related protein [Bradyrhizobium erythrophlei]